MGVNDAEAMKRLRPRFEPTEEDRMEWTDLHARILALAFERVLGRANPGSVAFVRCLTPDVVQALAAGRSFAPRELAGLASRRFKRRRWSNYHC